MATSAQIVALACQIAKATGFTSQAGQLLNTILSDLCQDYDFDVAKKTVQFNFNVAALSTIPQVPQALPANYLRAVNDDVFYTINGQPYPMISIDFAEFDWLVQQPGLQNFPQYYATDMSQSPPVMYFWMPPSGAYPVTVRYFSQMPDIATPESSATVPWFPNQTYLITRLSGELMKITNDERAQSFLGDSPSGAVGILSSYLKMKDDKSSRAQTVKLDRRRFRNAFNSLPNTKQVGW